MNTAVQLLFKRSYARKLRKLKIAPDPQQVEQDRLWAKRPEPFDDRDIGPYNTIKGTSYFYRDPSGYDDPVERRNFGEEVSIFFYF